MITVVLVLCMVGAILLSPLGVLFSSELSGSSALSNAIQEINQEFDAKLEVLKASVDRQNKWRYNTIQVYHIAFWTAMPPPGTKSGLSYHIVGRTLHG